MCTFVVFCFQLHKLTSLETLGNWFSFGGDGDAREKLIWWEELNIKNIMRGDVYYAKS
ncbi:hypothetical protein [Desulfofundulus kuznetsovii]|uniref:hypothetical protein n=1 Tax=Desulfofundulus kuznetsovii TaxID=58135 RepID=UPI0002DF0107